ncbi:MAG TPA: anhydro-N-acetylmuramic acid kinase [Candidatus Sulfotelmatobacter sp.]|jgi:anhydro-N-acetylmuramic acid kinase|nr:anhydro-N-acetylmuramic acid kinase [Candidatus Sulfotelmatobacter sp.]
MTKQLLSLGLMSGTSLDGVDAALIRTDGETVSDLGASLTRPYPDDLREALRSVLGGQGPVTDVERRLTDFHAETVSDLLARAEIPAGTVDVLGFHGHTILHRPGEGRTWQIGDGQRLAALTGIPVVNGFRTADVDAGGEGAPLVPVFHAALAAGLERPLAILNLGGVGNVTWIGAKDELLAFDTGPGNALIDDWVRRRTGQSMDCDGVLAAAGAVDQEAVCGFLDHPYFMAKPPKSLDRDDFAALAEQLVAGLSSEDGAATLTAFTVASVVVAAGHFPKRPKRWLVCGGGRRNPRIMAGLEAVLEAPVRPVDGEGWDGDALEAQAFAFLAVRSLRGLPLSFPGTTGVPTPLAGGVLHPAG